MRPGGHACPCNRREKGRGAHPSFPTSSSVMRWEIVPDGSIIIDRSIIIIDRIFLHIPVHCIYSILQKQGPAHLIVGRHSTAQHSSPPLLSRMIPSPLHSFVPQIDRMGRPNHPPRPSMILEDDDRRASNQSNNCHLAHQP